MISPARRLAAVAGEGRPATSSVATSSGVPRPPARPSAEARPTTRGCHGGGRGARGGRGGRPRRRRGRRPASGRCRPAPRRAAPRGGVERLPLGVEHHGGLGRLDHRVGAEREPPALERVVTPILQAHGAGGMAAPQQPARIGFEEGVHGEQQREARSAPAGRRLPLAPRAGGGPGRGRRGRRRWCGSSRTRSARGWATSRTSASRPTASPRSRRPCGGAGEAPQSDGPAAFSTRLSAVSGPSSSKRHATTPGRVSSAVYCRPTVEAPAQHGEVRLVARVAPGGAAAQRVEQPLGEAADQDLKQVLALRLEGGKRAQLHRQLVRHGEHAQQRTTHGAVLALDLGQDFQGASRPPRSPHRPGLPGARGGRARAPHPRPRRAAGPRPSPPGGGPRLGLGRTARARWSPRPIHGR